MILVRHELRRGKTAFLIWTLAICFLLSVSVFLFPEMKKETDTINEMFSSMGAFTSAFGMDKLNFGTLSGYYAVECGNVLGLGGAFFAALCAAGILCKEEKLGTADYLLTHPVSRARIVTEKLFSVIIRIAAMNLAVFAVSIAAVAAIGESVPWKEVSLLHLAYLILQIEIAGICFPVSAAARNGAAGAGLGIAAIMYFVNIIANITEKAGFLKYFTPFGYCEGADIVSNGSLDLPKIAIGAAIFAVCVAAAYLIYEKKDIR